ncbi:Two-component sensor histidine kinase, contains HisKA and HATPase domains [Cognatiyoonia koreensis]|uniref:histidine kinase n=1 Tax=Cognatiyoonia koreensis TaxID=364200 RepID=A0A1I0S0C7_9RHOB|nr:HWE histidine kinase domain-containing protein [Cognatiyoonia koreensis]SEW47658.1 Two-component sensor histidine kinase, contains HisKA and HATPase domains [Cognatiyoonia koreensis]
MDYKVKDLSNKFELGVKVAGIGLGSVDYLADTITFDTTAAELFDLPADKAVPRDLLHSRIHPEDWISIDYQVEDLLDPDKGANFIDVQHRVVHRNGDVRWVSARKQVAFSPSKDGSQMVAQTGLVAILDITPHKQAQDRIQYLLEELNHRSKNMLTVVQSIARRTFSSGDPETALERFTNRLIGLGRNYDALVKGAWEHAELKNLVTAHLTAFSELNSTRVQVEGPDVNVSTEAAQAIGMAMHELATNASKYGALSIETGHVSISWQVTDDPDLPLVITWEETDGPDVSEPVHKGFGQKVLQSVAESSVAGKASLEYRTGGVHWDLRLPPQHFTVKPKQ